MRRLAASIHVRNFKRLLAEESAATAIEYALIAAGVAGAIITIVTTMGSNVKTLWTTVSNALG
jgi:pilus assembly protein Flp/PilA